MHSDSTAPELTSAYIKVRADTEPLGGLLKGQHTKETSSSP